MKDKIDQLNGVRTCEKSTKSIVFYLSNSFKNENDGRKWIENQNIILFVLWKNLYNSNACHIKLVTWTIFFVIEWGLWNQSRLKFLLWVEHWLDGWSSPRSNNVWHLKMNFLRLPKIVGSVRFKRCPQWLSARAFSPKDFSYVYCY